MFRSFKEGFRNVLEGFRRFKEGFKKVLGSFLQVFRVWERFRKVGIGTFGSQLD